MEFESNLKVKVMGNYVAIQPVNKEDFTLFQKIENKESIITWCIQNTRKRTNV